jgi:NitT/TauT family transport system ATP-binding protein
LARTMITEPALLLLDEPFGALDERTREGMQGLLLKVVKDIGCSVILVTHDIREAILLGDRILMMGSRPGRILRVFKPCFTEPRDRKLLRDARLAQLYEEIVDNFPS